MPSLPFLPASHSTVEPQKCTKCWVTGMLLCSLMSNLYQLRENGIPACAAGSPGLMLPSKSRTKHITGSSRPVLQRPFLGFPHWSFLYYSYDVLWEQPTQEAFKKKNPKKGFVLYNQCYSYRWVIKQEKRSSLLMPAELTSSHLSTHFLLLLFLFSQRAHALSRERERESSPPRDMVMPQRFLLHFSQAYASCF